jgi:4-amino-4-deoxy-L-arabinose transferase-like glycosyltransferase
LAFSAAGTKLPGYVWPAYPALALLTADFLAAWAAGDTPATNRLQRPRAALDRVMVVAWSILIVTGIGMSIGLPLAAHAGMPGLVWLTPIGLVLVAGAVSAWRCQSVGRRERALGVLAVVSCLFVATLAAVGGDMVGGARGARRLVAALGERPAAGAWAAFGSVPPSVVFYAADTIPQLHSTEAVTAHLEGRPDAYLLVDARFEMNLPSPLPAGYGVITRQQQLFGPCLFVIGPRQTAEPSPETPLAWNETTPRR